MHRRSILKSFLALLAAPVLSFIPKRRVSGEYAYRGDGWIVSFTDRLIKAKFDGKWLTVEAIEPADGIPVYELDSEFKYRLVSGREDVWRFVRVEDLTPNEKMAYEMLKWGWNTKKSLPFLPTKQTITAEPEPECAWVWDEQREMWMREPTTKDYPHCQCSGCRHYFARIHAAGIEPREEARLSNCEVYWSDK